MSNNRLEKEGNWLRNVQRNDNSQIVFKNSLKEFI